MVIERVDDPDNETPNELSLEEHLHRAHQRLSLLADVFEIHAAAPDYARRETFCAPAAHGIASLCREAAYDLRGVLNQLPAAMANWTTTSAPRPTKRRR